MKVTIHRAIEGDLEVEGTLDEVTEFERRVRASSLIVLPPHVDPDLIGRPIDDDRAHMTAEVDRLHAVAVAQAAEIERLTTTLRAAVERGDRWREQAEKAGADPKESE